MAMGIRRPGYHLISLYAPLPPSSSSPDALDLPVSYTYTQTNCTLPDQLGTYLHLYLPLAASFFLFFLVPKLGVVARTWLTKRRQRRVVSARANGSEARDGGGSAHRHKRSLSSKLSSVVLGGGGGGASSSRRASLAEDEADAEDVEAQYPALLGGLAHVDDGGSYSPLAGMGEGEEDLYGGQHGHEALPPVVLNGVGMGGGGGGRGHVRRVSRVWLWEGTGSKSTSPRHSLSGAPNGALSTSAAANAPLARLARLVQRLADRLASNSLLSPLTRMLLRPVVRTTRLVWRKLAAPFVLLAGGSVGGPLGQALGESVEQTWEVAWPAVALWLSHVAWYSL